MDVLFDLESLTEWSSTHQEVEVLERDEAGHPTKSRQVVKIVGITDEQVLDYSVHDDGVGWTLVSSKQQRAQEGRYTLTPEGDSTRVSFELTVDPTIPIPGFLIKKGAKGLIETATDGLRNITGRVGPDGTVFIWGITSTVSGNGDTGADPNRLVLAVDLLKNTDPTKAAREQFVTLRTARFAEALRGVSFTPGSDSPRF